MYSQNTKHRIIELLAAAGINVNGNAPWDIQIHNERFYKRVISEGTLGLGESYMEGWWDCDQLDEFAYSVAGHFWQPCLLPAYLAPSLLAFP